jgi:hypothetical protein
VGKFYPVTACQIVTAVKATMTTLVVPAMALAHLLPNDNGLVLTFDDCLLLTGVDSMPLTTAHLVEPGQGFYARLQYKERPMTTDSEVSDLPDCDVCCIPHDDEIHAATLRVRHWLKGELTRKLSNGSDPVYEPVQEVEEPELVSHVA